MDEFNESMPRITHFVVIHACPRISQILLTLNRQGVMYSVFCIVRCVKVECKGLFFIQQHSNEQVQALVSDHSTSVVLDLCFISECTIIIFIPFR